MASLTVPTGGIVDAVAWVHIDAGRLLLARTQGKSAFYLPGGKPEEGESDVAALTRELREELGVELDADSSQLWWTSVAPAHGYEHGTTVRMRCYLGAVDGQPTPQAEIADLSWASTSSRPVCAPAAGIALDRLIAEGRVS